MKTLDLYLNEQLKNEEFRKEWEENQPEMDIIRAMADARISQHLTQKELAERTVYGDNVFEKCGINRDGAGEVGKPRYFNGKRHF